VGVLSQVLLTASMRLERKLNDDNLKQTIDLSVSTKNKLKNEKKLVQSQPDEHSQSITPYTCFIIE
jgi:hypothetical protein